jgi:hypothetical protein
LWLSHTFPLFILPFNLQFWVPICIGPHATGWGI